jgi:myo-inositol-1(or 4)-monophosphatase
MISDLLATMLDAARAAGEGLIEDRSRLESLDVRSKAGPDDVFSEADLRAEHTVRSALKAYRPTYGFLGEEGGLEPGSDPSFVWMVDPLDGTTNFLTGSPLFAVNIALVRDGKVVAGVTHVPVLGETFWAEEGQGAWLNDKRIHVSTRATLQTAVLGIGIPFASKPRHDQFYAEMERLTPRIAGIRRVGAGAIDMAWVACGRHDAYWEQSVSPWDMAAGVIIVEEAGGICSNTLGEPLDLMGGSVLASSPSIRDAVLDAIRPV